MNKQRFKQLIAQTDFRTLFIEEMGWNYPTGRNSFPLPPIDDTTYELQPLAERSGFQVFTCQVDALPTMSTCRKFDTRLRPLAHDYICIFTERGDTSRQQWLVPVNKVEKRDIVRVEYANTDQAEFLFGKMQALSFAIDEQTTIVEVKQQVQGAFIVNSERLTRDFYSGFRKQHNAFVGFITGIDDEISDKQNKQKQWYASVMLDRLMFCYFIQKKGFLNLDTDYLRHKLSAWRERQEGTFFQSFYRGFLIHLFHEGLNGHTHSEEFRSVYGRIPYLNGGMFDRHELEQMFQNIDIDDEAFSQLFDFFDQWQWHLDTRITASGKDINPDVLGYIFEQYINDRAAMGAYYTKEDITEYIGKNCLLPFLLDAVRHTTSEKDFQPDGYVWRTLRESGDRYIYEAVKHGHTPDWQQRIPSDVARGIDTAAPDLLERRAAWNKPAQEPFALPTEIWRETIERLQRCDSLLGKIAGGDVTQVNDLITLNLDIRELCYDLLQQTSDHLFVEHFYHAMQRVTILDPTCGSGAFLFAAMNILEPLYDLCITRMEDFHAENPNLFRVELDELNSRYRSNRQYFIYKSIILRNLYGVDIMAEAVEIAKLRLFLKMVAVVDVNPREDNLGLDPLPDIDFNIRCGNTLVGYATERELDEDLNYGDMFAKMEYKEKIDLQMDAVARIYNQFRHLQLTTQEDEAAFHASKQTLNKRLADLNDLLNHKLYASTVQGGAITYDDWLRSHQPFHWLAEFYQIIKGNGGFDVIIGNPPYVEYYKKDSRTKQSVSDTYKLSNYKTLGCGNLYAYVLERCTTFSSDKSLSGYIIPSASICTPRMNILFELLTQKGTLWTSLWDERPSKLFDGVDQQLSIQIHSKSGVSGSHITRMYHWHTEYRKFIFNSIAYIPYSHYDFVAEVAPKINVVKEKEIIGKIFSNAINLNSFVGKVDADDVLFYKNAGGRYWKLIKTFPTFFSSASSSTTTTEKQLYVNSKHKRMIVAIVSSSLFYWYWRVCSNCRHLTNREMGTFPVSNNLLSVESELSKVCETYEKSLVANKQRVCTVSKQTGEIQQDKFYCKLSKPIIDKIDTLLARHYGFTAEELDFIINYDIKYRMGDELNGGE